MLDNIEVALELIELLNVSNVDADIVPLNEDDALVENDGVLLKLVVPVRLS